MERVKSRTGKPQYPIGYADLDDMLWGLHRGELMIIAGRPSHGKTTLALNMAWNIATSGKPVIMLTLEMSKESVMERLWCREQKISNVDLRHGKISDEVMESADEFAVKLVNSPLEIVDGWGYSADEVEALVKEMEPEVIFVDHVQMVRSDFRVKRNEVIADYVRSLKDLATNHNVAIVATSQFNRQGAGKDSGSLETLKGSGEIEECADTVLGCRWPAKDKVMSDGEYNRYDIKVLKQRNGPCGDLSLDFEPKYYWIKDSEWKAPPPIPVKAPFVRAPQSKWWQK